MFHSKFWLVRLCFAFPPGHSPWRTWHGSLPRSKEVLHMFQRLAVVLRRWWHHKPCFFCGFFVTYVVGFLSDKSNLSWYTYKYMYIYNILHIYIIYYILYYIIYMYINYILYIIYHIYYKYTYLYILLLLLLTYYVYIYIEQVTQLSCLLFG